jgi:hypothetical protein
MLYSASTLATAGAGLLNNGSVPEPVLGNAITSRMDAVLQRMDISRSKPAMHRLVSGFFHVG